MKKLIILLGILVLASTAHAQVEPAKEQDIRKLLELTVSAKIGIQVIDNLIGSFKTNLPDVPDAFWAEFRQDINEDDLLEMVIVIYDKHFTHEDIKGLIAFYETPLGRKITDKLPLISQESMQAGAKWGEEIAQKAITTLQKRGY